MTGKNAPDARARAAAAQSMLIFAEKLREITDPIELFAILPGAVSSQEQREIKRRKRSEPCAHQSPHAPQPGPNLRRAERENGALPERCQWRSTATWSGDGEMILALIAEEGLSISRC